MNALHLRALLVLLVCLPFSAVRGQTLEIHTINVGHGDAGLIVVRDTAQLNANIKNEGFALPPDPLNLLNYAITNSVELDNTVRQAYLIDYGDGSEQGVKIAEYLVKVGVDHVTGLILSHNHKDHYGGFKSMVTEGLVTAPNAYYRGNIPLKGSSGFKKNFLDVCTANGITVNTVTAAATNLNLGTFNGQTIRLTAVAANGYVLKTPTSQLVSSSQNDYGCGWVVQYGAFRFFTGGDLSGFDASSYTNVETPLADKLVLHDLSTFTNWAGTAAVPKGHVCALKLNHHGSKHSSNAWFLHKLSPRAAFISCGEKHGHPNLEVISDLIGPLDISDWTHVVGDMVPSSLQRFYLTALRTNWGDARDSIGVGASTGTIGGNLILIVNDANIATQSEYKVWWDGEKDMRMVSSSTKAADMRNPNAAGSVLHQCHKATVLQYFTQ